MTELAILAITPGVQPTLGLGVGIRGRARASYRAKASYKAKARASYSPRASARARSAF